ncbi:MAG: prepilin-type N-terminal cleavage/methylation domain-containing protein [Gemmatimonadetes bacterium]|uniref:Prepilin-type N-terminal cleavage/methylation domain-containing protein n=1 Tax=Candidatus Kutchimonas denitrificans TaxID=3056748 RepID=A0AAE4ZCM2_9BACT|nr:prepilin-type N-terminal cleavage/methylation domain-containing protein [Gemmatimonadota bacterium]NIR75325.1 prepilin-type N-terminal cleavage/methylation domain-containing protein [Candidatus Kutchimonas denitrificans]NIS02151.1 prepilin-type N-terminal cleavage/methylation domain-containing protein [Gemmatimonadota bacterium]NIT67976.1 prepilin-type N-terminal cleavage/methylation domain-containing protein [Gemmatimonadota bacterium]NIU53970.1 prepilin-type N-terminal cleavage/methylation
MSPAGSPGRHRSGFTFIELMIALTLGVIVLAAAVGFVLREMRGMAGSEIRQSLARNGRYIGVSLRHDVQRAGIELTSSRSFGTVAVWPGTFGDTLVVLHIPYEPDLAPPHSLIPPAGSTNPLPPGGTCGLRCLDLLKRPPTAAELEIRPGDLARLQIPGKRQLIMVQEVEITSDTSFQVRFTEIDTLLHQPASMTDGMLLDQFGTFVQEITPVMYYLDGAGQLMRSSRLNMDGSPDGHVLAYGVKQFDVRLLFADGDEHERAEPLDTDDTNDYDDIVAVSVRVTVQAERADIRVNRGELLERTYEWTIAPRNLRYEKFKL